MFKMRLTTCSKSLFSSQYINYYFNYYFCSLFHFIEMQKKMNECKEGISISSFPVSSVIGTHCFVFAPRNTSNTFWKGSNKNKLLLRFSGQSPSHCPKKLQHEWSWMKIKEGRVEGEKGTKYTERNLRKDFFPDAITVMGRSPRQHPFKNWHYYINQYYLALFAPDCVQWGFVFHCFFWQSLMRSQP